MEITHNVSSLVLSTSLSSDNLYNLLCWSLDLQSLGNFVNVGLLLPCCYEAKTDKGVRTKHMMLCCLLMRLTLFKKPQSWVTGTGSHGKLVRLASAKGHDPYNVTRIIFNWILLLQISLTLSASDDFLLFLHKHSGCRKAENRYLVLMLQSQSN